MPTLPQRQLAVGIYLSGVPDPDAAAPPVGAPGTCNVARRLRLPGERNLRQHILPAPADGDVLMRPVMYLLSNPSVEMSTGKRAAQIAHAAVEAYILSTRGLENELVREWRRGGHYTKIVLQTDDLLVADRYLRDRGFSTALIIDEGRTEFNSDLTPTAIGVEIVDKDDAHVAQAFEAFKLYKDKPDLSSVQAQWTLPLNDLWTAPADSSRWRFLKRK